MAVSWNIIGCNGSKKVDSLTDVITEIFFEVIQSEGERPNYYFANIRGSVKLSEPDSKSFIALASITNANLIAWTKTALGSDEVTKIETSVAAQIAEAKTPTVFSGFVPSS